MSRYRSHLEVARQLIEGYQGETPFALYLKKFFSGKKKFGSTDRKTIAGLCYNFFRTAHALKGNLTERIVQSFFLMNESAHPFLEEMDSALNKQVSQPIDKKLDLLQLNVKDLFPFRDQLSDEIKIESFCKSFLHQPSLFLRPRPGKEIAVLNKLEKAGIPYERPDEHSLQIANGTKLEDIISLNKEAVVQDISSQHTLDYIGEDLFNNFPVSTWDCCAASGGKSILAFDRLNQKLRLTVTDIRSSILKNLMQRLAEAGVPVYHSAVADLGKPLKGFDKFDVIICDAPCTGSGTWARTPEQLYSFKEERIGYYASLQQSIINNAIPHLNNGGIFVYITCSVFAEENERQVDRILKHPGMDLLHRQYIKGYTMQADTLFTSTFRLSRQ